MSSIYDKIKKIEALIQSTNMAGERQAAMAAKERLEAQVPAIPPQHVNAIPYKLSSSDRWHKQLLLALCSKHGLKPYRYHRQKYTTTMVKCNQQFMNRVLWPEYLEYAKHLEALVNDITADLINKIHEVPEEDLISGELDG